MIAKTLRWQHSLGQRDAHDVRPQSITCLGRHDKLPVWKEGSLLLPFFSFPRAKMVGQWWNQDIIFEILKDNSLFYFLRKSKSSSLQNQGTLSKGSWSFSIFSLPQYGSSSERQECGLYCNWRRKSRELSLFVSTIFHGRVRLINCTCSSLEKSVAQWGPIAGARGEFVHYCSFHT